MHYPTDSIIHIKALLHQLRSTGWNKKYKLVTEIDLIKLTKTNV